MAVDPHRSIDPTQYVRVYPTGSSTEALEKGLARELNAGYRAVHIVVLKYEVLVVYEIAKHSDG